MDLHTRAVPGDEAVHNSRMERWMEVTLMRGRQRVCQRGITSAKKLPCTLLHPVRPVPWTFQALIT